MSSNEQKTISVSGLNAIKDSSGNMSEMGAALVQRSRGPSMDIKISNPAENMPRGYTTIDIDPGLSFEESDEEQLLEADKNTLGVELLGSKVRARSGTSLVSSRSKKHSPRDNHYLAGPQNTDE